MCVCAVLYTAVRVDVARYNAFLYNDVYRGSGYFIRVVEVALNCPRRPFVVEKK